MKKNQVLAGTAIFFASLFSVALYLYYSLRLKCPEGHTDLTHYDNDHSYYICNKCGYKYEYADYFERKLWSKKIDIGEYDQEYRFLYIDPDKLGAQRHVITVLSFENHMQYWITYWFKKRLVQEDLDRYLELIQHDISRALPDVNIQKNKQFYRIQLDNKDPEINHITIDMTNDYFQEGDNIIQIGLIRSK